MTIEQIVGASASDIEAMDNAKLLEHFNPYLQFTRPDLAAKPEKSVARKVGTNVKNRDVLDGLLGAFGMSIDELKKR